jgi:hypothetical protein
MQSLMSDLGNLNMIDNFSSEEYLLILLHEIQRNSFSGTKYSLVYMYCGIRYDHIHRLYPTVHCSTFKQTPLAEKRCKQMGTIFTGAESVFLGSDFRIQKMHPS